MSDGGAAVRVARCDEKVKGACASPRRTVLGLRDVDFQS